jgi:hypothetical protein
VAILDSGEPFGLPKGTVRGVIALGFAATLIEQVVVGAIDPITFIAVSGPFLGFYAAGRPTEAAAAASEPLAAPYAGDDSAN